MKAIQLMMNKIFFKTQHVDRKGSRRLQDAGDGGEAEAEDRYRTERDAILVCRATISAELPGDAAPKWSADAAGDDHWLSQVTVGVCHPPLRPIAVRIQNSNENLSFRQGEIQRTGPMLMRKVG